MNFLLGSQHLFPHNAWLMIMVIIQSVIKVWMTTSARNSRVVVSVSRRSRLGPELQWLVSIPAALNRHSLVDPIHHINGIKACPQNFTLTDACHARLCQETMLIIHKSSPALSKSYFSGGKRHTHDCRTGGSISHVCHRHYHTAVRIKWPQYLRQVLHGYNWMYTIASVSTCWQANEKPNRHSKTIKVRLSRAAAPLQTAVFLRRV